METIFLVGCGGFIGSICRYLVGYNLSKFWTSEIPYSTVLINLVGSLTIGLVLGLIDAKTHPKMFYFLVTGILGGFTTFSAFSAETISLLERQFYIQAMTYVLISLFGGITLSGMGFYLGKQF